MLPIKKIYIDSRFKTYDSKSNSDFKIQLPQSVSLPKDTIFYIENFVCAHAFYSVEKDLNDSFYIRVNTTDYIIKMPPNNYTGITFASTLQTLLNSATNKTFTITFNINQNNITISIADSTTFKIYTENDLNLSSSVAWNGPSYNKQSPNSTNDIFNNNLTFNSPPFNSSNPYTSGSLQLLAFRNIYLHSNNLSSYNTLGSRGESTIIKKIPVASDFGFLIIDSYTSNHDYLELGGSSLCNVDFQLKDIHGNLIPLHGSHVSFSIVFSNMPSGN